VWAEGKPIYSGVTFLETNVRVSEFPQFAPLVGLGAMYALDDGKGLIAQHNSGGRMMLYSAVRVPEDWHTSSDVARAETSEEKIALMLKYFEGWDEALLELIRAGEAPTMRPMYALPWDSAPRKETDGIVLLGDAAHLMSPFAGEGVNLAMADAADLAKALTSGQPLEKYEKLMRKRANESGRESATNLELFFGDDAAKKVGALFKGHEMPRSLTLAIHGYYYLRSLFS
jgi:2-polyprenyl-6-methoxyphenol hydroxylase-like FAD-dependent oxidoreductase